jgi:hypothetical protein
VNKNSGQGKGYPNSDETFQDDFNELLFILIVLKLIEILGNSCPDLIDHNFRDSMPIIPHPHGVTRLNRISVLTKGFAAPRKYDCLSVGRQTQF